MEDVRGKMETFSLFYFCNYRSRHFERGAT